MILTVCVEISFESQWPDPNQTSFNQNGGAHNRKKLYIYVHTFHGNQLPISSPSLLIVFAKWAGPYQEMFTVNDAKRLRLRSIGKSGFRFSKSKSRFPNRTRNPKTFFTPEKSVLRVDFN